jgi:hypothetical protein
LNAATIIQTLGASAGFADGSTNARAGTWNTDTAGNPVPFNGVIGSDPNGPNFSASWMFSYSPIAQTIVSATLEIGIYDISSMAPGNQVASYTEGTTTSGITDLTALLNAVSEGLHGNTGAVRNEYDLLTISLPSASFADLALGHPTISLALQGPGLGVLGTTTFNGAGIDFSTLTITTEAVPTVPEPGTWALLLAGIGGLAGRRWLRRTN